MKMFVPLAYVLMASVSGSELSLEDVYGPVPRVESMAPIAGGMRSRAARPASFYDRRSTEICDFPFEILVVQDITASFNDNFEAMVNSQLPEMFSTLGDSHPDSTYGVVTFRDKPIYPLGNAPTDFCQEIGLDFTTNTTAVTSYYELLRRLGGGDPSENQFGALIASIRSNKISWSANTESSKLIVLVTDAPPHFEGDGHNTFGMQTNTGSFSDETADEDCLKYYYPSPDQVLSNIKGLEAYFAVLVYDPEYWNGLPAKSWQWFNRFLGQTDDFANLAANDQSDFWSKLSHVIQFIENLECNGTTTTPAPTVTPVGTTQAPPSSTASEAPTLTPPATPPTSDEECPETIICQDDVLIKVGFKPDNLDVVVDGKQIA